MITVLSTRLQNADHLDGNFGDDDDDNGPFSLGANYFWDNKTLLCFFSSSNIIVRFQQNRNGSQKPVEYIYLFGKIYTAEGISLHTTKSNKTKNPTQKIKKKKPYTQYFAATQHALVIPI